MGTNIYQERNSVCSSLCRKEVVRVAVFCLFFLIGSFSGHSQTNLSFSQISTDFLAPARGPEHWGTTNWDDKYVPKIPAGNSVPLNFYTRFNWKDIESDNTQGSYNWTVFDNFVHQAIDNGAMYSFGVMPMCSGCGSFGLIPTYLHNLMQQESTKDWQYSGQWIPNWNSPGWQGRWAALVKAVADHINSTTYKGVAYKDALWYVDVRGYGDFGEWHTYPWISSTPSAAVATSASLKSIVEAVKTAFPNNQLVIPMGAFDTDHDSKLPADFCYYALTTKNNFGEIGWRRDNIGDDGYNSWLSGNPGTYNGQKFSDLIMNKWKVAPIGGEPAIDLNGTSRCGSIQCDLMNEITTFHMSSFGNGNFPIMSNTSTALVNAVLAGSKACGYRLVLTGGNMTTTLSSGSSFNITLNWQNIGVAPVYENWNVVYELRDAGGKVVWTGNSAFKPRYFLPGGATPAADNFTLGTVAAGTYSMYLIIKDPANYKKPLPLAISGRNSDGSYLIRSNITVGTGTGNKAPTANAGNDQTIQLPTVITSLAGTGTDADGTIASYAWAKVSGPLGGLIVSPASANTSITGLLQGVYVYSLTVTDNQGSTATDNVQITVAGLPVLNQSPVANAGSGTTLTLPANSTTLNGSSSSDPDGSISSYAWSWISGPAQYTIANKTIASTALTNLAAGVYAFQLKVTDNDGATAMDTVKVTVKDASQPNQPPVANAGSAVTLTLPANSTTLNGSSSSDPDGSISSYAWSLISGPTQYSIANSASASTALTNLAAGVYAFQLKVTDNDGATALDTVKITVNNIAAPANQPPVANAGTDITLTLPANVTNLTGNASSDADGTIAAYAWTKISGPALFNLVNATTANARVGSLVAGTYSFQLKVTDNDGATAMDTVKVTVNAAPAQNQPPIANAGAARTITLPASTSSLDGSASLDQDGTINTYAWSQVSGPSTAVIESATTASTNISGLTQGEYIFSLQVTDNDGAKGSDSVTVTVNAAANKAPVANAGNSRTITLPVNSANLSGSLSSDPDGTISSYAWAQISGPSTATITGGATVAASVADLVAGQYTFQLTVTDNDGATARAQVKITVAAAGVQPPVANAGANQTITLPVDSVRIDGSGSSSSTGSIVGYVWREGSGPSSVTLANTAENALDNLQAGVYIFYLTVTDNNAATATDSVIITVKAANKAPVASAGSNVSITLPRNTITLDGSKSYDPDGTISTYTWTRISGPNTPASTGANTETLNISGLIAGQYTYRLTVTDNSGASSSAQVKISVALPPNQSPYANAGSNQTITSPANSVKLDGSDSYDPDGTLTTYSWVKVSGPGAITISNSNTTTPSVTGLQTGSYVFELTVTDNRGATATDQVTITVNPKPIQPNQLPIANAGSNSTITIPVSTVTLNGSSSFDPDGTITGYSWTQVSGPSTAGITGGNTATAAISKLVVGQYIFELTVTDNNGATDKDQVTVNVNPSVPKANQSPVASAGADTTISLPVTAYVLDATGSDDPDGTITSYQWQEVSGPNTVTSSSMDNSKVSIGDLQEGEYTFQVTVTDNNGISSSANVKITVEAGLGLAFADQLLVYPNPAHNVINGRITSPVTGTVKISIYDMNGREVQSDQVEKSGNVVEKRMYIHRLASGVYTIQVSIGNRKQMISKFIKN